MKKTILILILLSVLFLVGCQVQQEEDVQNGQPIIDYSQNDNVDETIIEEEPKQPQETIKEFTVEGDDLGLYPKELTVSKNDKVKITFKVRNQKVYYGGLDFRSSVFNTGTILPGNEKTVEFTAQETFTYTSYWPASGVKKTTGKIIVN